MKDVLEKALELPNNLVVEAIKGLKNLELATNQIKNYMSTGGYWPDINPPLLQTQNKEVFMASLETLFTFWQIREYVKDDDWSNIQNFASVVWTLPDHHSFKLALLLPYILSVFPRSYMSLTSDVLSVCLKVYRDCDYGIWPQRQSITGQEEI